MIEDMPIQQLKTLYYQQDTTGQTTTASGPQQSDLGQRDLDPLPTSSTGPSLTGNIC